MIFLSIALISFLVCSLIVLTAAYHGVLLSSHLSGPQKLHEGYVPRLAGLGLISGLICAVLFAGAEQALALCVLLSVLPLFIAGIAEDVTGRISPAIRLAATLFSGLLFVLMCETVISRTQFELIDLMLEVRWVAILLTILSIAAFSNAMNMIDGLNGLSFGTALCMSIAIAFIGQSHGDGMIAFLAFGFAAACFGCFILNFPFGRIFSGDGGAYLMGGVIAMLTILLVDRNPNVSAFSVLLIILYPFYEMMRTIARRLLTRRDAMLPDRKHLHSLIFSYHARKMDRKWANPLSAMVIWVFPAGCCVGAVIYAHSTIQLAIAMLAFVFCYELVSWMLKKSLSRKPS